MSNFRVLAILCVRNEAVHLRRCLSDLIASNLDVFLIDNGSSDGSREIAEEFWGRGVVGIDDLKWSGAFSLSDQLNAKRKIWKSSDYDWIIHVDADEKLISGTPDRTLYDGILDAHQSGYTHINFHEIVFIPMPGEDFVGQDYTALMSTYYFFQPVYPRLNRAWNRRSGLDNSASGGHRLAGVDLKQYPIDFFLCHYIVLSETQARTKYLNRRFATEDLQRGWHGNRMRINDRNIYLREAPEVRRLDDPLRPTFDLSAPLKEHFWDW